MHMVEFIGELANSVDPPELDWQLTSSLRTDKEQSRLTIIAGDSTGSERIIHRVINS